MAIELTNRVVETTQTTGTGTIDLDGAQPGYRAFSEELSTGTETPYLITDDPASPTVYEYGIGTWSSGSPATLARDMVQGSSNGGNRISLQSGKTYVVTGTPTKEFFGGAAQLDVGDDPGELTDKGVASQSDHDSPSGVEKLARLDRLEESGWIGAGTVIQEVVAISDLSETRANNTYADTSFASVQITPKRSNSIIEAEFSGGASLGRIAGDTSARWGSVLLENTTDSDSSELFVGRTMNEKSTNTAFGFGPISIRKRIQVNSTDTRTYRVRFRSGSSDIQITLEGDKIESTLTLREIAQ